MSTANFEALLNTQADEIEPPKPMPAGSYTFNITRHDLTEVGEKNTPVCDFYCKPVAAGDDVDQDELPDNWREKEMRLRFFLTEAAMFRLKDFLKEDLELETAGRAIGELIPEGINQQFLGQVEHSRSRDGKSTFANINDTAPAE